MTKKKANSKALVVKGTVLPPEKMDSRTRAKAMALHSKIVSAAGTAKNSFVSLSALLAKMKTSGLWAGVTDETHKGGFSDWDAYKTFVLGSMGKSRFYELISVHELTQGDSPLAQSTIAAMGIKRAAEVARLEPHQRTPHLLTLAQSQPLAIVKAEVQNIINGTLPKDKQKESTAHFIRMLPPTVIAQYEELEARGVWMEGICDHDPTMTAKQKLFLAMIMNFEANHVEELQEADERRKEHQDAEAVKASKANGIEAVHETDSWAGKRKIETAVAP